MVLAWQFPGFHGPSVSQGGNFGGLKSAQYLRL